MNSPLKPWPDLVDHYTEQTGMSCRRTSKAQIWFPREPKGVPLEETVICINNPSFPYVLGILQMPMVERDWNQDNEDDELLRPLTGLK